MEQVTRSPALPARPADGHKGTFGKVLVLGGSEGMLGAPAFTATAALRMGCGLVYIAAPAELLPFIATMIPEMVGVPLNGRRNETFERLVGSCEAIVAGPGLGAADDAAEALAIALKTPAPLVLDADGLNLLAAGRVKLNRPVLSTVLTPHPGEMARLLHLDSVPSDEAGRLEIATVAARTFGQVVVLKGHRTIITDGNRYAINTTGDTSLAKAGSGDILAGMLGTLLAQKMPLFEAAHLAAHYHGKAGELAGATLGQRSVLARDVLDAIGRVLVTDHDPEEGSAHD